MPHNRIIKECSAGKYFDTLTHRYAALIFDDIVFVDRNSGVDTQDGQSWDTAVKTINKACDKISANKHCAIAFRGRITGSLKETAAEIIDIASTHLIGGAALFGKGGGNFSAFLPYPSVGVPANFTMSGAITKGGLEIYASGVEVCGMKFYGYDVTQLMAHIVAGKDDGAPLQSFSIHDCDFQGDVAGTGEQSGIALESMEGAYIGFNNFYYDEYGITLRSGGSDYSTGNLIEENIFRGVKYGVRFLTEACLNTIRNCKIQVEGALGRGWALTTGFLLDVGANDNLLEDLYVMHATVGNCYVASGSNNVLQNCKYGVTSGTLVTFA